MATVNPFICIHPNKEVVSRVAALPYDVYNRQEAKRVVEENPQSFLCIDRAEVHFSDDVSTHDFRVYEKAHELLESWVAEGILLTEEQECYYIYELTMDGRAQTGIVACASIDDYQNNIIKRHEATREEKELDRICHVDVTNAHTGPIFLTYRSNPVLNALVNEARREDALFDFTAEDGVRHRVWRVEDSRRVEAIGQGFSLVPSVYIADGHHRAASAVKVGLKRRAECGRYTGKEPFNFFLSVLFPDDQLMVMPYNRAVKDLNGHDKDSFLKAVSKKFKITPKGTVPYEPMQKGQFGMYLEGSWYCLQAKSKLMSNDFIRGLDVSVLQRALLRPILGIEDPRTDERVEFIGGIRGLKELERRVGTDMAVAFSMYPTSLGELFAVADDGFLMPPKSTWFEPKLRSGLFIHRL